MSPIGPVVFMTMLRGASMSFKTSFPFPGGSVALLCLTVLAAQAHAAELDEVQVTAKKRSQSALDVDIAINAFDPDVLQTLNFRALPDAAALAENVALFEDFSGAAIPTWVIRGVGVQDYNTNNTPTAAVYFDGSYQVSTAMGAVALFDVDSLEVLKGPQGGLYGRNTTGGAVIMQSRRASLDGLDGDLRIGYGNWNASVVQGALNLPLSARSAVRLAVNAENSRDGWQRSLSMDGMQGDKQKFDARAWWRFDLSDDFRVEWKLQGGRDNSDIPLGRSLGVYAANDSGDYCAAVLAGVLDETDCINWGGVNRLAFGTGIPERILDQSDDGSVVLSELLNRQDNDYVGSVLELHWTLDFADFLSLSTFDRFNYGVMLDLDGGAGEYGHRRSNSDMHAWSQEFRLAAKPDSQVQWVAGVSVSRDDFKEQRDFMLRENRKIPLGHGLLRYDQDTKSVSAYADVEWPLNSHWALAGGLRWTDENKTYRNGDFWVPLVPTPIYIQQDLRADYDLEKHLAGSLALQWRPDANTLGYLKYSSGFKSGGFYGGFPFDALEIEPYREETLNAWEAGVKLQVPAAAMELSGSIFRYALENVQGFIRDTSPQTGTGVDRLANQGDAVHQGVELQVRWQALSSLALEAGLGWLDAEFRGGGALTLNLAGDLVPVEGRRPYAPRFSGHLLASYEQSVSDAYTLMLDASYDYRSDFTGFQSSPVDAAINHLPGYGLINLAGRLRPTGTSWELGAWVRNAADERYLSRVKNDGLNSFIGLYGEPRSYGLSLSYRL
jgi:iron complex outermembrane receptor protein